MDQILCPKCGAALDAQPDFDSTCDAWTCTECATLLYNDDDIWVCADAPKEEVKEAELVTDSKPTPSKEELKKQKKADRRAKRWAFRKKHWKAYLISIAVLIVAIVAAVFIWKLSKLTPINISPDRAAGKPLHTVVAQLEQAGFTHISTVPLEDLAYGELNTENQIVSLIVNGSTDFEEGAKFPYDCDIQITYHSAKAVSVPFSASEAKKMNYADVRRALSEAGFGDIRVTADKDLVLGWFHKDGDVEQVLIDGQKKFKSGSTFRVDAEIEITYHTFKKEK